MYPSYTCPSTLPSLHEFQKRELGRREVLLAVSSVRLRPRVLSVRRLFRHELEPAIELISLGGRSMSRKLLTCVSFVLLVVVVPGGAFMGLGFAYRKLHSARALETENVA